MDYVLNLTENIAMQDLVRTIAAEVKCSPTEAVIASITRKSFAYSRFLGRGFSLRFDEL